MKTEVIKLAIEKGGYELPFAAESYIYQQIGKTISPISPLIANQIVLDPLFWQALGKALGWDDEMEICFGCGAKLEKKEITPYGKHKGVCNSDVEWWQTWKFWAHQYFDLVLTGGDADAYWKGLLNGKM